jgi:hypothetical protein
MNNIELKIYLEANNKSGFKTREKHIKNNFPDVHEKIINLDLNNNWFTNLYDYIHNITENKLCPECGKVLQVRLFNLGYPQYCSTSCKNKNVNFKEKVKKICLLKYGVDNPSKSNVIKEKIKNKLCVDGKWYNETEEYKEKRKKTCLKKYGVEHFSKTKEYHKKVKETSIDRYGVDSYNKTEKSKNETKKKNLEKYGVEWYQSTNEFKEKSKETCLKKYGLNHHTKTIEYKDKMKKYNLIKYGVEYPMQTEEFKKRMIDTMIHKYGEIWLNFAPKYNTKSIYYLDLLSENLGIIIQHALNGGEKKFVRYWVDGYIEKYNICIEWDEKHHNGTRQKERDIKKELFLIENFSCKIIRINEKEFLKNIETSIDNLSGLILELIDNK